MPLGLKVNGEQGKWLLRKMLEQRVPATLTRRPKAGFAVPIGAWLRGPLRDWAESMLSDVALADAPFLDAPATRALWREHVRGRRDNAHRLWSILMFQAWTAAIGSSARP